MTYTSISYPLTLLYFNYSFVEKSNLIIHSFHRYLLRNVVFSCGIVYLVPPPHTHMFCELLLPHPFVYHAGIILVEFNPLSWPQFFCASVGQDCSGNYSHLKGWLGLEVPHPRWFTHMAFWQDTSTPHHTELPKRPLEYPYNLVAGFPHSKWLKRARQKPLYFLWPGLKSRMPSLSQYHISYTVQLYSTWESIAIGHEN